MTDVSKAPGDVAMNALQNMPFGTMIGGPLKACVEAQALAAKTTYEFIKEVGFRNEANGDKSAVNVAFTFNQGGHLVQMNVPLLTIIPIPFIAIRDIDINFKAKVAADSSAHEDTTTSTKLKTSSSLKSGWFVDVELKASFSSKKDSKATTDSKYSVESTIDVAVKAGQDSVPAGMAKVLEILQNAVNVASLKGELMVDNLNPMVGDTIVVSYKNKEGVLSPDDITIEGYEKVVKDDVVLCELTKAGKQKISAGECEMEIEVGEKEEEKKGKEEDKGSDKSAS